jgi:hypothetical protein
MGGGRDVALPACVVVAAAEPLELAVVDVVDVAALAIAAPPPASEPTSAVVIRSLRICLTSFPATTMRPGHMRSVGAP